MIVVFGSMNLDIFFQVRELPAPGETVLCPEATTAPGGKGANQALAARRAGAEVAMVGKVGRDGFAQEALRLMAQDGVDLSLVGTADVGTACAAIAVDAKAENAIVVGSGANLHARADQVPDSLLESQNFLLLQMEVDHAQNWEILSKAKSKGLTSVLNLAPAAAIPEASLKDLDYLVVNELEAAQLLGMDSDDPDRLDPRLRELAEAQDLILVMTLGAKGCRGYSADGVIAVPALAVDPTDTTGAGDCFTGYFTAALQDGADLEQAMRRAATAASLCCTALGAQTAVPWKNDVTALLAKD